MISWLAFAAMQQPRFRVLALYENGGHHIEYSKRARVWLDALAQEKNFSIDYLNDTDTIDKALLAKYRLFIQLDYPPYAWKPKAVEAFEDYIDNGRGGWVGFHHASLIGEFDGYPMWKWFWDFMGQIRFKDYIPNFAAADVQVEDPGSPIMAGLAKTFHIDAEEWYTYDQDPRPRVKVLASVREDSYQPNSKIKMGDHPVIWTNPAKKARNVYIFMGHTPKLYDNPAYTRLVRNAILWAAGE